MRTPVPPARAVRGAAAYSRRVLPWLQRFGSFVALSFCVVVASIISPNFLTQENIRLQLQTFCLSSALIGVGQTLVILTGGIDLSVGALLAVGSCLGGLMINNGLPIPLAFAAPDAADHAPWRRLGHDYRQGPHPAYRGDPGHDDRGARPGAAHRRRRYAEPERRRRSTTWPPRSSAPSRCSA